MKKIIFILIFLLLLVFSNLFYACDSKKSDIYTATFIADGEKVSVVTYKENTKNILVPKVPIKEHYIGVWEEFKLENRDVVINALYTPFEYTVTFVCNNEEIATLRYTVETTKIDMPKLPFGFYWPEFNVKMGGDQRIEAIEENVYTIIFCKDYIYNSKGEIEELKSSDKLKINVPEPKRIYNNSELIIGSIEEFTLTNGAVNKKYQQLRWVFIDGNGVLKNVVSGMFDKSKFDNKTEIILYMQYLSEEVWLNKNY